MAGGIFEFVITPVLISGVITFLYGQRSDGLKASRDFTTKSAEAARDDVKKAAELAVEYFATGLASRSAVQEAKILVAEKDVKNALGRLIAGAKHDDLAKVRKTLTDQRVALLAVLTGGSFQQRPGVVLDAEKEAAHIRSIASEAANVRATIAELRDQELRLITFGHNIADALTGVGKWLKTPMGVPKKRRTPRIKD